MSEFRLPSVSVVVPVFNNAETLSELVSRLLVAKLPSSVAPTLEICLVDDGSTDDSWTVMRALRAQFPDAVTVVRLSRNFGQVGALLAGYRLVRGDAIMTISADLQDDAALLTELTDRWVAGADVVIANRAAREDSFRSLLISRIAYGVARRGYPKMPAGGFDCFLLSRRAMDVLNELPGNHRFLQGDVLWLGLPTVFVPYTRQKRPAGKSGWTLSKRTKYFVDLMIDATFLPIKFMSRIGILVAIAGLLYAVVIVVLRLLGETPIPGWAPLMITGLLVGGVIMVMLGIIGEYVWRMNDEIRGRPPYLIAEVDGPRASVPPAGESGASVHR